jgi:uncharacterized C2H2 Zn-finger protein
VLVSVKLILLATEREPFRRGLLWQAKNPDKVLKTAAKARNKAKDGKRFYCNDCDMSFASQSALNKHNNCSEHKKRAASIEKPAITKSAVAVHLVRADTRAKKTFSCQSCDKVFPNDWSLQRHLDTPLHKKKLLIYSNRAPQMISPPLHHTYRHTTY